MSYASRRETQTMVGNTGIVPITHGTSGSPQQLVRLWYPKPNLSTITGSSNLWHGTVNAAESIFFDPQAPNKLISVFFDAITGTISAGQTVEWPGVGGGNFGTVDYIRYRDSPAFEGFLAIVKDDPSDPNPANDEVVAVDVSNDVTVSGTAVTEPFHGMACIINHIVWYSPGDNTTYDNGGMPGTHPNAVNEYDEWEIQNHQGTKILFEYRHHTGEPDSPAIYTNRQHFPNLNIYCPDGFRLFIDKDASSSAAFINIGYRMLSCGRVRPDNVPRN